MADPGHDPHVPEEVRPLLAHLDTPRLLVRQEDAVRVTVLVCADVRRHRGPVYQVLLRPQRRLERAVCQGGRRLRGRLQHALDEDVPGPRAMRLGELAVHAWQGLRVDAGTNAADDLAGCVRRQGCRVEGGVSHYATPLVIVLFTRSLFVRA